MVFLQAVQLLHRWFLKHLLEHVGRLPAADKHAMVFCDMASKPETIADDVSLRDRTEWLRGAYIHVAADNHRVE